MPATMSTLAGALKNVYLGPIAQAIYDLRVIRKRIKKNSEDVRGGNIKIPTNLKRNVATTAIGDGGTYPTGGHQGVYQTDFDTKDHVGAIRLTTRTIRHTESDKGAFKSAVKLETDGLVENLDKYLNILMHGNGTGKLAKCAAGTTVNTVTVVTSRNLEVDQIVDIVDEATGVAITNGTGLVIDDVPSSTTFHFTGTAVTVTTAHIVVKTGTWGKVLMGLEGIIATANPPTGSFQGLSRATYSAWKSNVIANGGTARTLTIALMEQAYNSCIVGGGKPSLIVSNFAPQTKYLDLQASNKRFLESKTLDGGFEAYSYKGVPWVADPDAFYVSTTNGHIDFLDESVLYHFLGTPNGFKWDDTDGNVLKQIDNTANVSGFCIYDAEFGTRAPRRHARLADITTDAELETGV